MPIHVAILKRPYLQMILRGEKTVESRLTRTRQPPYRAIEPGERLFLKVSAGPFVATAVAGEVEFHEDLTPAKVDALRARYQPTVRGDDAYWHVKRDSRYATFIHLTGVEPLDVGPKYPPVNMKAWHLLDERLSPLREVEVTAGAIRNRYAAFPFAPRRRDAPESPSSVRTGDVRLDVGDETITTHLARGRMLRWRGWGGVYAQHGVQPGDVMRYVCVGPRRYRVSFPAAGR